MLSMVHVFSKPQILNRKLERSENRTGVVDFWVNCGNYRFL